MKPQRQKIEMATIDVAKIKPSPYNPRRDLKPGDPDYEKLKQSIKNFGYVDPIIWNKNGHLVGGHQRFKILLEMGLKEIEVVVVDLSPEDEKKLCLALNRIQGRFDEEKLASLLDELSKIPDFDIQATGFDLPEIGRILDAYQEEAEDKFDFEADLKANQNPVTKLGDIIDLGPHRMICGDSSDPKVLKALMGKNKAALLDCDFPYNVSYMQKNNRPSTATRPKKSRRWNQIYYDSVPQAEYEAWMRKVITNVKEHLEPGAAIYIWQGHRQFPPMYQILLDLDFHVACVICWLKESAAISYADYSFRTEQCLYGWLKGASHYFAGPPAEPNLWEVKRDPTKFYQHPTQKPVALAERAIRNSSKRGDIVLDTFLGSGSCLIGAESLGRRCFGVELDPRYVDGIVRRYIAFVGEDKVSNDIKERYLTGKKE